MIPALVKVPGGPFEILPPGVHWASLSEVKGRFGSNPRRLELFGGIMRVAAALRTAGCQTMYLDGSFTTSKLHPQDFDGCWDARGVIVDKLDHTLLDFTDNRRAQKHKFLGEMFISNSANGNNGTFLAFFQRDKHTGASKGVLAIDLSSHESFDQ